MVTKEEVRALGIANASPSGGLWTLASNLGEHLFAADSVEGVGKIHLEDPFSTDRDFGVIEDGICRMDGSLCSASYPDAKLKRS